MIGLRVQLDLLKAALNEKHLQYERESVICYYDNISLYIPYYGNTKIVTAWLRNFSYHLSILIFTELLEKKNP